MEKYIQPTIFDEKGRPESSVVSAINRAEAQKILATPEQLERVLNYMKEKGIPLPEAIAEIARADAQEHTNDAYEK